MATNIAISAGGADAVDGSNVGLAFDGSTNIVVTAHDGALGTLIPAANCTWEVLDVPKGTTFDAAWFNTNTASWPNVNTFPTVSNFVPDKEGTWFFRCTNADGSVDEVVVGVRHQRTHIRVPAAGETTEANSTRGWAENRNDDLDTFDDLITSGGIQLCRFVSASAGAAGTLVQFNGATHDINPTSGAEEFVPDVEPAANNNPGIGRYLGVIKAKKDGSTPSIASGSLVWVSRSGMVEGSTAGILDLSSFSVGDSIYVGSNAGLPASSTDVDTATATLAGFVIRAENPGAMVVSPAHINNVLTTKSNSTDRDQQFVEVDIFEAPISSHNLFNLQTTQLPHTGYVQSDLAGYPGAKFTYDGGSRVDIYATSISLDERCVREGASGGSASNFMEYPLVVEVHGFCSDLSPSTAVPRLTVLLNFNFDGIENKSTTTNLIALPADNNTLESVDPDLDFEGAGTKRQLIFRTPLFLEVPDSSAKNLQQYYLGHVSNDMDFFNADSAGLNANPRPDRPPVSVDISLSKDGDVSFGHNIIITKVVLKALYPVKSRAKRLSFYEKQIPAAALVDTSRTFNGSNDGVLDYSASTLAGLHAANVLVSDTAGDDDDDFSTFTANANLRGETAGTFCGFLPFDDRAKRLVRDSAADTDTRDLRFRAVCKFKRRSGTSGSIKLRLYARGEARGEEFNSLALTSGSDLIVNTEISGDAVAATLGDGTDGSYRTIVFDFALTGGNFNPNIAGIRFRLERLAPSGFTNKTVDNLSDASTSEQAFCVSTVCLSEKDFDITKDRPNVFEEHILLDRYMNSQSSALNLTNWANTGSDVCGFKFGKGGSEILLVPIRLDERYDEQSDLTVHVIGTVAGTTSSATTSAGSTPGGQVSLQLQAGMTYVDQLYPSSLTTIAIANEDTSTALTGSNLYRTIVHTFTVPFSVIAQASGIVDDNLSIPKENVRGDLWLRFTRTDTTGPNTYLASSVSAVAGVDKLPNADPYINISENPAHPILVPGGFRHDAQRDILTTVYRHNWQFGVPDEFGIDLRESAIGGQSVVKSDNLIPLLPSNFVGNTPLSTLGMGLTFGGQGFLGIEPNGKHIPFSMVITGIHGFMGMITPELKAVDGGAAAYVVYNKGFDDSQALIRLNVVTAPNFGSSQISSTGVFGEDIPGVIGFPFDIYPNSNGSDGGGGMFRVLGNDLSTNSSKYNKTTLPRVYLPKDYQDDRQLFLVAYLVNINTASADNIFELADIVNIGDRIIYLQDVSQLREEGRLIFPGNVIFDYNRVDRDANTVSGSEGITQQFAMQAEQVIINQAPRELIAPIVDLNIEVAFLPNTTGNDLIY